MAYADYSFYTKQFLGVAIAETDFERLSLRASQFLDYYTGNRAKNYNADDSVKNACCALAETYQAIERTGAKAGISSESVGSYSVSYTTEQDVKTMLANVARRYLAFTGLLYRGGCR